MGNASAADLLDLPAATGGALRRALIAAYGPEVGAAATVDAITWGALHADQLGSLESPAAHLYRIGRRRARRRRGRPGQLPVVPEGAAPWIDAVVPQTLLNLPRRQRVALLLCHGFRWSESETAEVLGVDGAAIRGALDSGLTKLRAALDPGRSGEVPALLDQIAAYAEVLDGATPQLDELIAEAAGRRPRSVRWRAGPVLSALLAGVLVVVGVLALRGNRETTGGDAAQGATTVAAALLPGVDVELVNRSAITPEMFPKWEHQFAGPGAVTVVDGAFHMLSAAYGDDVATVAYAVSDDGIVWQQAADRPVLDLADAPWAPLEIDRAAPRSVIVDGEGTWQLFFDIAWFDRGANQLKSSIGRAVAPDPAATWIFDPEPIITRDEGHPWMADRVSSPSVTTDDGSLVMLFVGEGSAGGTVGTAGSPNGAVWSVRPDPVYPATGGREGAAISQVDLVAVPGGMAMFYGAESADRRGLALSADGVEWVPYPGNPLLTTADASVAALFDTEFVVDGGNVLAYVETGRSRGPREVAVLRLTLDLPSLVVSLLGK